MNCTIPIQINGENGIIKGLDFWENINIKTTNGLGDFEYDLNLTDCRLQKFLDNKIKSK